VCVCLQRFPVCVLIFCFKLILNLGQAQGGKHQGHQSVLNPLHPTLPELLAGRQEQTKLRVGVVGDFEQRHQARD